MGREGLAVKCDSGWTGDSRLWQTTREVMTEKEKDRVLVHVGAFCHYVYEDFSSQTDNTVSQLLKCVSVCWSL